MAYRLAVTSTDSRVVFREENTVLYNDGARLSFVIPGSKLDASVTSLHATATFDLVGVEARNSQLTAQMTIGIADGCRPLNEYH